MSTAADAAAGYLFANQKWTWAAGGLLPMIVLPYLHTAATATAEIFSENLSALD